MQNEFLAAAEARLADDPRVAAAWLGGSFGRGAADRWSDIDLHLLLAPGDNNFRAEAQAWLATFGRLVLYRLMFDGRMINALMADGLRIDIWLHDEVPPVELARVRVLLDPGGRLPSASASSQPLDPAQTAIALRGQIEEFWRCIALMPTVMGRRELLVAFFGLDVELGLVIDLCLRGRGIVRESGVKTLNRFLPDDVRQALEEAIALDGLAMESLVAANLRLVAVVQEEGRRAAARWGFDYPAELEQAVLAYVTAELAWIRSAAEN